MRNRIVAFSVALLIFLPAHAASAADDADAANAPAVIKEAFLPGSELYDHAIDLLEYQGTISASEAKIAKAAPASSPMVVTYGAPIRTAYFDLDIDAQGAIAEGDLYELPDRYIAVQYVNGAVEGTYTVDVDGESIEMGTNSEVVISALENWSAGAIYATGTPFLFGTQVSADGSTVTQVGELARKVLGSEPVSAYRFRQIVAKKETEVQAEASNAPTDDSYLVGGAGDDGTAGAVGNANGTGDASQGNLASAVIALLGVGAVLAIGVPCLLSHRRRNF